MLKLSIKDEFSTLKAVVLGTAESFGGTPNLEDAYDPKSAEHIKKGTFPTQADLLKELEGVRSVLEKHGVTVFRPSVLEEYNQIFSRDIGFVIDNKFVVTNMISERSREIEALEHLLNEVAPQDVLEMTSDERLEGGDIMPVGDHLFVGYSKAEDFAQYKVARTNSQGLDFLRRNFPEKTVKGFELKKSDTVAKDNALHLDCCFQPLGLGHALLYPGGFKNEADVDFIRTYFGADNIIEISQDEMYHMGSNVFSIARDTIISERNFTRINSEFRRLGYTVEEVAYAEVAKMEGLLRCSTLPLCREN